MSDLPASKMVEPVEKVAAGPICGPEPSLKRPKMGFLAPEQRAE
jgi:hypothetical protein